MLLIISSKLSFFAYELPTTIEIRASIWFLYDAIIDLILVLKESFSDLANI